MRFAAWFLCLIALAVAADNHRFGDPTYTRRILDGYDQHLKKPATPATE